VWDCREIHQVKRFWDKVKIAGPDECWEWQAHIGGNSYGKLTFNRTTYSAHRFCFMLEHHEIPDGMFVMHTCDNRICVNPKHLKLGTHKDNMRDMATKGRSRNQNKYKTHCPRGHMFSPENTSITKRGSRVCKECKRIRSREYYARRSS
jgi:hypothetical protein